MQITASSSLPISACAFSTAAAKDACTPAYARQADSGTTPSRQHSHTSSAAGRPAWIRVRMRAGRASAMATACHCAASIPGGADLWQRVAV
jgi:hypothetical protein